MSLFFYKKENNWVCVFCVLMAIVFCGLMIVSVVALFIPKFNIETKSILDFNTLLSVLSLTFVISIASPYFISKNQIRDEVRKYLENEYKNYVEKEVEHITRTDAHLSRMIAFFLMDKKFYYWAIGWAFRALKRYKNIAGEYNNVYKEFHEFLFRDVILKSLDELKSNSKDCSAAIFYKIKNDELELNINRIKIRAIKDYVDFEYEIKKKFVNQPYVKFMKDNFSLFINEIENDMPRIIQSAYKEFKPECFFTDKTKAFKREILNISSYKNEHKNLEKFLQSMNLF